MKVIPTKSAIQQAVFAHRCLNQSVGLVPTMGALHKGHLALVNKSKENSEVTVVSIFVNPVQFSSPTDLEKYPRVLEADLILLEQAGVDYVFVPDEKEMYPEKTQLKFNFFGLETPLEGAFRPGHFNGVGIIVSKLFHIVHPSQVYLGQKDLQQVAIIKRLVDDLSFDLQIIVVPTQREADGLAMSSRNALLGPDERKIAPILYHSLSYAKDELFKGKKWLEVKDKITELLGKEPLVQLEYVELVKSDSMELMTDLDRSEDCSICIASFVGKVRLIDNLSLVQ